MKHLFLKTILSLTGLGLLSQSAAFAQSDEATASPVVLGDSVKCQSGTTVQASFGGLASSGFFSDGGAGGTFTDVQTVGNTVSAFYNPSPDLDTLVILTFTTNDPEGPAGPASSSARFWVAKPISLGPVLFSQNPICAGGTVTITVASYFPNYRWVEGEIKIISPDMQFGITVFNPPSRGFGSVVGEFRAAPNLTGSYEFGVVLKAKGGCPNDADTSLGLLHVVSPAPTAITGVSATVCAGQALALTAEGGCPGTMTALLSNASGSFANPTVLGEAIIGGNSLLIPAGVPAGTSYRVRLVKDNATLATSDAFRVNGLSRAAVALYPPTTPGKICQGEALPVAFSLTPGTCPFPVENVFTVELSNSVGSFSNPSILGTALPGTTVLPASALAGLPAGTGYRVRIVSSNPAQTSPASAPFQLASPSLSVTPTVGGVPVCRGSALTVSFTLPAGSCPFPGGNGFTAQLSSATGSFNNPTILDPVTPGVASSVTIPAGVATGTGYRIRVVSSSPASASSNSAPFQVKACASRLSAEEAQLVVSPNPVQGGNVFPGEIRCRVSGLDNPHFSLTTFAGKGVGLWVKTDGSGAFVLTPKQRLTAGVYVVQASEGTTRLTQRVLVTE